MQITLKQPELEEAVRDYIAKSGIVRPVGAISFTATRSGDAGILTEVEVVQNGSDEDKPLKRSGVSQIRAAEPTSELETKADDRVQGTSTADDREIVPDVKPEKTEVAPAIDGKKSIFSKPR